MKSSHFTAMMFGILIAAMVVIIYLVFSLYQNTTNISVSEAVATEIESLVIEPVIVEATVLDQGRGVNLRRDPDQPAQESDIITPGTEFKIRVDKVIKGKLESGQTAYVAVQGGEYKGEESLLRSNLNEGENYLFFLSVSAQGSPHFYGRFLPHIFQFSNGVTKPIVTEYRYRDMFKDTGLAEADFYRRLDEALEVQDVQSQY